MDQSLTAGPSSAARPVNSELSWYARKITRVKDEIPGSHRHWANWASRAQGGEACTGVPRQGALPRSPRGGRRRSPRAWCPNKRCPSHMVCSQQKWKKTTIFWTAVKHQLSGHLTVWNWRYCSSYMKSLQCIYCISVCSCFFYFSHTSKPSFPSQNTVGV